MAQSVDVSAALREAVVNNASITSKLAAFSGSFSVHTRRPVPADAPYPMVVISPDISVVDFDGLTDFRDEVTRDIFVFGPQPAKYRDVESVGHELRKMFHRNRRSISVSGHHVISITATGPMVAPTDNDELVGRFVSLTIRIQPE